MLQSVATPPGTGKSHFVEALGQQATDQGMTWPGSPSKTSAGWSAATAPTTPSPRPSKGGGEGSAVVMES